MICALPTKAGPLSDLRCRRDMGAEPDRAPEMRVSEKRGANNRLTMLDVDIPPGGSFVNSNGVG